MKPGSTLYFIGWRIPEPVAGKITRLKEMLSRNYGTKAALRSPPHITVFPPFSWSEGEEGDLVQTLLPRKPGTGSLKIHLEGFGRFGQEVIFIQPQATLPMFAVHEELHRLLAAKLALVDKTAAHRPFHPHVTIGNRDWNGYFETAWLMIQEESFTETCQVDALSLFRYEGKQWNEILQFPQG